MENIKEIIKNHLSENIILMDLLHDPKSDFLKVTIDSPDSISIKETSKIAKCIKNDDSILSIFPNGCRLEVGTPGVGAKLIKKFHYEKNIGRKIFIEYKKDNSSVVSDIFLLNEVQSHGVKVSKNKRDHLILFEHIISAKIKVSFD